MRYSCFCVATGGIGIIVECLLGASFDVVGYEFDDGVGYVGVVEFVD